MEEVYEKSLVDYLKILQRRKGLFLAVMAIILGASIILALTLPAVYRSTATILIEQQEVPQDFVRSLVTSFAEQRIQVIKQKILSTKNLVKLIDKYDLYRKDRKISSMDKIVDKMRENIGVEMLSADVIDPRSGSARRATIAFQVSFSDESPKISQSITNELVTLFLNENLKNRSETAVAVSAFLSEEAKKLEKTISDLESKLAKFKEKNAKNLPELATLNLQMMNRIDSEIIETKRAIADLEERKVYLAAELSQQPEVIEEQFANPNYRAPVYSQASEFDPDSRLEALQAEYTAAIAKYSPSHPDVQRLKREIESLQAQTGGAGSTVLIDTKIAELQAQLASARERYSANHPDIKRLERELSVLKRQKSSKSPPRATRKQLPFYIKTRKNPAYVQLKAQYEAAETEIGTLREKLKILEKKYTDYSARLAQTPQVEREYKNLVRDYEAARKKYQDITEKELEAQLSQSLESDRKGERFSLIEPPILPEEPYKPNRIGIFFLGLVLSIAGGLGAVGIAEVMNDSIRGRYDVLEAVGDVPLAVIPYIVTAADRRKKILHRSLMSFGVLMAIAIGAVVIHFYLMPLDVLWFKALRRLGL